MRRRKAKPPIKFLAQLGQITISWNEIEGLLKGLLILFVDDPIAPITMAAGMNVATLISVIRTLAYEIDAQEERTFKAIPNRKGIRKRKGENIAPHIDHALSYADRLREYRNYYLHCLQWSASERYFVAHSISGKGRLTSHHAVVSFTETQALTDHLRHCVRYFDTLIKVIAHQKAYVHFRANKRPTWPKKPPLPDKHQRANRVLLDAIPPPSPYED